MIFRALAFIVFSILFVFEAAAQRLVASSSDPQISINSTFSGEEITFFGNIEKAFDQPADAITNNYHIVIAVRGPTSTRVARRKTNQFGIWLNGEEVGFKNFPSFFHIISNLPLNQIADRQELSVNGLAFDSAPFLQPTGNIAKVGEFSRELIRLMEEQNLYKKVEHGVTFHSDTFYSARIDLPAHVPNGHYIAITHLFQDGKLKAKKAQRFSVQTVGFERFLSSSAKDYSFFYGLVCVLLAIFTGWLSGVAFRR
ncbi:TIGR02186 family protein [Maritalea porphyrae]|uniref:Membrane protein n=1 Tax=Maritalea porphyrae TaxID=880732 RepID=A0ABQ5UQQ7_9HYPH|nr:TIGR02186 family protein [Maritalea porphyrae]GLQ17569.1 membrane protein [Maritalea porphyrae]